MLFSSDIKLLRKRLFLSQKDLAKEIGVSFATINRRKGGMIITSYKTLKKHTYYYAEHNIDFASEQYIRLTRENVKIPSNLVVIC